MSHIAKIELEIRDVDALKRAAERMGWQFMEGQTTYKWYGKFMGDWPLPEGVDKSMLGHCEHAIRIPGINYEIGVLKVGNGYQVLWDFWDKALKREMDEKGGKGLLKQAYTVEVAKKQARKMGYRVEEKKTETGIRLTIVQGR